MSKKWTGTIKIGQKSIPKLIIYFEDRINLALNPNLNLNMKLHK